MGRAMSDWTENYQILVDGDTFDDFLNDELSPLYHLKELDTKWILEIDLPGVNKKDISVNLTSHNLVIEAKLEETYCVSKMNCIHEFNYFKKSVPLPAGIDERNIIAKFDQGVLTIFVPKILKGKTIQIE